MTPVIAVFDDFFPDHPKFKASALGEFGPVENPADGTTYKGIASPTTDMEAFVAKRLEQILGAPIRINFIFARLMTKDFPPSKIHADHVMGEFSMHVYMNDVYPPDAGTRFWTHEEFGKKFPSTYTGTAKELTDKVTDPNKFWRRMSVKAEPNRALIHDSRLWHSAAPMNGYGTTRTTGRIVLTAFFSKNGGGS